MAAIETRNDYTAQECIDGIRLALEGAASDETAVEVIRWIVDEHAPDPVNGTRSVRVLLDSVKSLGGRFSTNQVDA